MPKPSALIMSDSPSVASRPNESELDLNLAELVNWQIFATHLPDLTRGDIEQIEQDNRDVRRQKLELYGIWLRRCPNASWNDIVLALENSKENTLAAVIKTKFISNSTAAHNPVQLASNPEVYLLSEEVVVEELKQLHRSFTSAARDIRCKLDELVKSGKSSLHDIVAYIEEAQVHGMKRLTEVNTIDDLFDAIRPHNDYLDCELLEMIVEEYLDDDDITKLKAHIDKVKLFKRTTPIKTLKDKLHQYTSIPNISDKHLIVTIKLQADWGRVTLESIEKLVQNLLQYQHKVRILKVESGSISVMLLLPKEKLNHFIVSSSQKLQFMRLTGIFRLQIGAITVFEEIENNQFTFDSAFLESSQCGDDEALQFLLDLGVNVNYSNSEGQTALILASKAGHEEVVEMLISAGANINHHDINGNTALMFSNTINIFLLLLPPHAHINFSIHESTTPLMIASDLGYLAVVESQLRLNNNPNVQNLSGWSAIIFASRNGHLQVTEILLKKGANPNIQSNRGWTALMFASQNGHFRVVEVLLKKGADPNIHSAKGQTAFMLASSKGHLQVVELLLKESPDPNIPDNNGWTALLFASFEGHLQIVELLLKKKADPSISSLKGWTPLIIASMKGDLQLAELLLKEKADPNAQNNQGRTAEKVASGNGHLQIGELLLKKKVDPNVRNNAGWTALMYASDSDNHQMVEMLLENGADPNIQSNKGVTALMSAIRNGCLQVVELLLKEKADPNIHCNEGWTPLMGASDNGHLQIVELLLKKNANPNVQSNKGVTALMFASQIGDLHVVELLLQENADPNVCSSTRWTALLLASKNGHSNVVALLLQYKANPHIEIRKHLDSFTIATVEGNTDVVNTFLNYSEIRFESLSMGWYYACQLGHVPIIALLSNRIDIVSDQTDLITSCAEGDLGILVDQLMSDKMIPDVQFIHGITPLMISSSCGHADIVEALIQSGANVNKTDEFGYTALDFTEQAKQDTTRVLLLQHDGLRGIDLDIRGGTTQIPKEPLLKPLDNISTELDNISLQLSDLSTLRRRQNVSTMKYHEDTDDTRLRQHENPLITDLNDLYYD